MLKKTSSIFEYMPDIFYLLPFLLAIVIAIAPTKDIKVVEGYYLYWGTLQTEMGTDIYMMVEIENGKKVKVPASKKQLSRFKKGASVSIVKEISSLGMNTYSIKLSEQKITEKKEYKYDSPSSVTVDKIKMSKAEKIIFFSIGLWFIIVFFWLNILASIIVISNNFMTFNDKRHELMIAWLIPYFGAIFVLHMNVGYPAKKIPRHWIPFGFKNVIGNH